MIQRALKHYPDDPLYVVAVGAITNVDDAIFKDFFQKVQAYDK